MSTRYLRRAARVILTDSQGLCLLFRFSPDRMKPFWFPPGGECEPGEDFPQAARRELFEETGIAADPRPLGFVMEYDYTTPEGVRAHALEHFFHLRTASRVIDTSGHTELERARMRQHRWFAPHELADWPEIVHPANLAVLLEEFCAETDQ